MRVPHPPLCRRLTFFFNKAQCRTGTKNRTSSSPAPRTTIAGRVPELAGEGDAVLGQRLCCDTRQNLFTALSQFERLWEKTLSNPKGSSSHRSTPSNREFSTNFGNWRDKKHGCRQTPSCGSDFKILLDAASHCSFTDRTWKESRTDRTRGDQQGSGFTSKRVKRDHVSSAVQFLDKSALLAAKSKVSTVDSGSDDFGRWSRLRTAVTATPATNIRYSGRLHKLDLKRATPLPSPPAAAGSLLEPTRLTSQRMGCQWSGGARCARHLGF